LYNNSPHNKMRGGLSTGQVHPNIFCQPVMFDTSHNKDPRMGAKE
jgi:hypothetical protein